MARQNTLDAADANLGHTTFPDSSTGHIAGHVDGHMFTNTGREIVEIIATGAATVIFPTPSGFEGLTLQDPTHVFAGVGRRLAGPFPTSVFNQKSGADRGKQYIDITGTPANVSFKVYRLPV
jgi:hypothetical protein